MYALFIQIIKRLTLRKKNKKFIKIHVLFLNSSTIFFFEQFTRKTKAV